MVSEKSRSYCYFYDTDEKPAGEGRPWKGRLPFHADTRAQKQAGNVLVSWFELSVALLEDLKLAVCLVLKEEASATHADVLLDPTVNSLQCSWLLIY